MIHEMDPDDMEEAVYEEEIEKLQLEARLEDARERARRDFATMKRRERDGVKN